MLLFALLIAVTVVLTALLLPPFGGRDTTDTGPPTAPEGAPNVLVFVTDDQRPESMEAMPQTSRYFRDEGRWYPNGFATTPICCPSRASIFSGQFVHNHGVKNFTPYELQQTTTLQAVLQANGYRTGFFGKYLNRWEHEDDPPHFDDWAFFHQANTRTYAGGEYNVAGEVTEVDEYSTHFLGDRAIDFLEGGEADGDSRPWLMYVSTPAAHTPYIAETEFENAPVPDWEGNEAVFEEDLSDKPAHVRDPYKGNCDFRCGQDVREQQHRTLMSVDVMVDAIMTKLEELDQADNTLAFFVSDNGIMWGEHGVGNKRWPYRQSVNVPFGVRWPAKIEPGVDHRLVAMVDIAPTAVDAAGARPAAEVEMDGRSLLDRKWERTEMLLEHWPSKTVPGYGSLWSKDYQYVEYYARNMNKVIYREYFDLVDDPWQLKNLLAGAANTRRPNDDTLRKLSRRLRELRVCKGDGCP